MSRIVGIGANVYDTLITVPEYPSEDTKMRGIEKLESGGGPCATGLVAAAKLGADTAFIGVLSDDAGGKFLKQDMEGYGMDVSLIDIKSGYQCFSSFIILNELNATRTCVFHKGNLPPLILSNRQLEAIKAADVLMIDGNEMPAAIEGARYAKECGTKVLYDAGGLYDGIEKLLPYADILIPSEEFSLGCTGAKTSEEAAKILFEKYNPDIVVITCGKRGGILYNGKEIKSYPAFPVEAVDSNGAGDCFHGAFAFAVSKGYDYESACVFSSAVSAVKCTKIGARQGTPDFETVNKFLSEKNIT